MWMLLKNKRFNVFLGFMEKSASSFAQIKQGKGPVEKRIGELENVNI